MPKTQTAPETDLVPLEESTDLVASPTSFSSDPDFGSDDVTYPRLKLLQGISPEVMDPESDLKAGQFYISGDAGGRKEIVFIPVAFNLTRRYEIGSGDDKTTSCQSADGKIGVGDPGGPCKVCPLSQWDTDPANGRRFLACQPTYCYVGYVPGFGVVALNMTRTASNAAKMLNGMLQTRGFAKFGIKLNASQVEGNGKRYFVPTIKLTKIEDEDMDAAHHLLVGKA